MRAVDLIRKKREGQPLDPGEIAWMVEGLATGAVPDYQWAALLMAIVWRGLDEVETAALTEAMTHSGTIVDLSDLPGPKVDKHSTGGVGDQTSLVLAPIAAAAGVVVPMVSGRGLGHTGGTLDKVESIPGFRTDLDLDRYHQVLRECGLVLIGPTAEIAPADRRLYALRDATGTVESIPLIAASILSKKLAEGIDGLVLDVKVGDGAFLPGLDDARILARTMVALGRREGKRMSALITRMDQPLGRAVGNAVEVAEALDCLRGSGPADLVELSVELAAEMVRLAGLEDSIEPARARCLRVLADGSALDRLRRVIAAQGGDPAVIDDPNRLPQPRARLDLPAPRSGFVQALAARPIGRATMLLGAGRTRVDSPIDPAVGVILHKKVGDPVGAGEPLATLLVSDESSLDLARATILNAYTLGPDPATPPHLIAERI